MLTELKTIFEKVDSEILNEETLNQISTLVEQVVDKKVQDRLVLETEAKLQAMDEDHALRLEKFYNDIDNDHTEKVKLAVEAINKDHVKKLNIIKEKYEDQLKNVANKHREQLVESINKFFNYYLDKNLPKEQILEAAKNKHLEKVIKEAKEILGVDASFVKDNIKSAIKEGKQQLDKLVLENEQLKKAQLISESRRLVLEKTANLPADLAKFVRARLSNRTPEFIKENFKYVVEMYERNEKSEKRSVLNEHKNFNVDRTRVAGEIIKESSETVKSGTSQAENPQMAMYLEGMGFRK